MPLLKSILPYRVFNLKTEKEQRSRSCSNTEVSLAELCLKSHSTHSASLSSYNPHVHLQGQWKSGLRAGFS